MTQPSRRVPPTDELVRGLSTVVGCAEPVRIERAANPYQSSFESECVTWVCQTGEQLKLFVKYGDPDAQAGHGYWRGVQHEASVYRNVLERYKLSSVPCLGWYRGVTSDWLVLRFIESHRRANQVPGGLMLAANWLATLHAQTADAVGELAGWLPTYGDDYFAGWARRTARFASPLGDVYPWLEEVCCVAQNVLGELANGPVAVLHGEFFPANILITEREVLPVDWQSAAVGRPEIDLASLLEGWDLESQAAALSCYARVRWPEGAPRELERGMALARLYWPLRWLGDVQEWTLAPGSRRAFSRLHRAASALGLVEDTAADGI